MNKRYKEEYYHAAAKIIMKTAATIGNCSGTTASGKTALSMHTEHIASTYLMRMRIHTDTWTFPH